MRLPDHSPRPQGWRAPGCASEGDPALADLLGRLDEALVDLGSRSLTGLADGDVAALLDAATAARSRVDAVAARTAVEADRRRLGDQVGARNTAVWWAWRSRLTRAEAGRLLRLGHALVEDRHAPIAAALADGELRTDQAGVIVEAIEALPADLRDPTLEDRAERHLLADAADHDAGVLRLLGRRILERVAPEIGEAHEQRLLEREERAAAAHARLTLVDDGHGRCHGRFTLPTLHGEMLRAQLMALANPRRRPRDDDAEPAADEPRPPLITPERLGEALMEHLERYPTTALPRHGGTDATVTVTIGLEALREGLGAATLTSGARISAGEARRLACRAGLVPAVLGGPSEVLDVGRERRLFRGASRRALDLRDGGCTARECGLPPSVCHAHHDQPWSLGGPTDRRNGRLLCPRHHRLAHDSRYAMTHHPGGAVDFHRRT